MGELVSILARKQQRAAEEHARALVLFECAAALARQSHPGLLQLIEQSFGREWLEHRVRETARPRGRRRSEGPDPAETTATGTDDAGR